VVFVVVLLCAMLFPWQIRFVMPLAGDLVCVWVGIEFVHLRGTNGCAFWVLSVLCGCLVVVEVYNRWLLGFVADLGVLFLLYGSLDLC